MPEHDVNRIAIGRIDWSRWHSYRPGSDVRAGSGASPRRKHRGSPRRFRRPELARKRLLVTCRHVVGDQKRVEVFFPHAGRERADYLGNRDQLKKDGKKSVLLLVSNAEGELRFVALGVQ